MPRRPRVCPPGFCFHVLNRAVARLTLFEKPEDYEAFERVLEEACEREALPIFAYTVMPNHWHFVVRPEKQENPVPVAHFPAANLDRVCVNKPQTEEELQAIRKSVIRGTPFGGKNWVTQSAARLKLQHTIRSRGRPKKKSE